MLSAAGIKPGQFMHEASGIYIYIDVLIIVSEIQRYRKDRCDYYNIYFVEPVVFVLDASDSC